MCRKSMLLILLIAGLVVFTPGFSFSANNAPNAGASGSGYQRSFSQQIETDFGWLCDFFDNNPSKPSKDSAGGNPPILLPIDLSSVPLNIKVEGEVTSDGKGGYYVKAHTPCKFSFDQAAFEGKVNSSFSSTLKNFKFHSMHYLMVFSDWDQSKVALDGAVKNGSDLALDEGFIVTDPCKSTKIIAMPFFTYDENVNIPGVTPKQLWCFASETINIISYDETPPSTLTFSQPVLFTTTGHKISDFNKKAAAWKFQHPNAANLKVPVQNPEDLAVFVMDDSPFCSSQAKGFRHGRTKPSLAFYVEVYKSYYKTAPNAKDPSLTKIERTLGETVDESVVGKVKHGIDGRFYWVGPIWADSLKDWTVQIKPAIDGGNNQIQPYQEAGGVVLAKDKLCSAYVFSGPIKSLEAALEAVEPGLSNSNVHYASQANFIFRPEPLSKTQVEHTLNDSATGYEKEHVLRIAAAVCDASGNLNIPAIDGSIYPSGAAVDPIADFSAHCGGDGNISKVFKNNKFDGAAIIPYDDRSPVPILNVTNTETNVTTSFTIPCGDVLDSYNAPAAPAAAPKVPYVSYDDEVPEIASDVWHFKYDNTTPLMKWLETNDNSRYVEYTKALTINEDVRLIYEMVAYDNINKNIEIADPAAKKMGRFGISTPMHGADKNDESLLRYDTWRIDDPTGVENLLYESKDVFVYPDYIFRNPEQGKTYKVSFMVEDFSQFFNKAGVGVDPQPSARRGNIRQIILEFKIEGKGVSSHSMGGTSTTRTTLENNPGGKK